MPKLSPVRGADYPSEAMIGNIRSGNIPREGLVVSRTFKGSDRNSVKANRRASAETRRIRQQLSRAQGR